MTGMGNDSDFFEREEPFNQEGEFPGEEYRTVHLSGMYENWFLDYASYVILERAVPDIKDGMKPVQKRILHAMKELDDGRYTKVANIIGHTMKYHPHGDASIGDALVQLGQKDLLIDTQGNWGNLLTGDSSAAPRYIEARLSRFALEVVFNAKTTTWKLSYDGRNKEPVTLPVKFPLLLAHGVEGIAVGLASKILPHNFNELIDASVKILQGKEFELYPDFPTGGLADFSRYQDGTRGGRVRIRAKINKLDNKTLSITEIPYGTTTSSLIDSIVAANDKGKIKIKKIDDNTAEHVEIIINLSPSVSPDQTIDALYAFSNCEISISPNACVIDDGKPVFTSAGEILKRSTENTLQLLKRELEIRMRELEDQWHFSSLEKIFIENRVYRKIEHCETWDAVLKAIEKGLKPYIDHLKRDVTGEDIVRLTEIKIKRISKYNSFKADETIKGIESEMAEVQNNLDHLVDFAVYYFRQVKKKFGKGRERKTEIRSFDTIEASSVAVANQRLYINRKEGFAGTSLKRDEYVCECSDIDDVIIFRGDGTFTVTRVSGKFFAGRNVVHIDVFKRNDDRTIYNMIYRDGKSGLAFVKRFAVLGVTRDKEYDLTQGNKGSGILYFSSNPNGEAEKLKIYLRPRPRLKHKSLDFDFSDLSIKGRGSKGNILTKNAIQKIVKKEEGVSTLGAMDIWYDDTVRRLNADERGKYLGAFKSSDRILTILESGAYMMTGFDLSTHFEEDMVHIEKFDPGRILTVVYFDGVQGYTYVKRFVPKLSDKRMEFLNDHPKTRMITYSLDLSPRIAIKVVRKSGAKSAENIRIRIDEFIKVKSHKARGKRIANCEIKRLAWLEPLPAAEKENNGEDAGSMDNAANGVGDGLKKRKMDHNAGDEDTSGPEQMAIDF